MSEQISNQKLDPEFSYNEGSDEKLIEKHSVAMQRVDDAVSLPFPEPAPPESRGDQQYTLLPGKSSEPSNRSDLVSDLLREKRILRRSLSAPQLSDSSFNEWMDGGDETTISKLLENKTFVGDHNAIDGVESQIKGRSLPSIEETSQATRQANSLLQTTSTATRNAILGSRSLTTDGLSNLIPATVGAAAGIISVAASLATWHLTRKTIRDKTQVDTYQLEDLSLRQSRVMEDLVAREADLDRREATLLVNHSANNNSYAHDGGVADRDSTDRKKKKKKRHATGSGRESDDSVTPSSSFTVYPVEEDYTTSDAYSLGIQTPSWNEDSQCWGKWDENGQCWWNWNEEWQCWQYTEPYQSDSTQQADTIMRREKAVSQREKAISRRETAISERERRQSEVEIKQTKDSKVRGQTEIRTRWSLVMQAIRLAGQERNLKAARAEFDRIARPLEVARALKQSYTKKKKIQQEQHEAVVAELQEFEVSLESQRLRDLEEREELLEQKRDFETRSKDLEILLNEFNRKTTVVKLGFDLKNQRLDRRKEAFDLAESEIRKIRVEEEERGMALARRENNLMMKETGLNVRRAKVRERESKCRILEEQMMEKLEQLENQSKKVA